MKVITSTSASQVSAWETCERFWFHQSVAGLREPSAPHQLRGTHVDLRLQGWFAGTDKLQPSPVEIGGRSEEWSSHLKLVAALLPPPGDGVVLQAKVDLPTFAGGPRFIGYPDLAYEVTPGHLQIDDLKTTSDFKYCKSADELADNTQMLSYARWGYESAGAELVSVAHVYARTKGAPRAHRSQKPHAYPCDCAECKAWISQVGRGQPSDPSPVPMLRAHVEERWALRMETVRSMVAAGAGAVTADELEPSTQHCDRMYGKPCPYRERCGFTTTKAPSGAGRFGMGDLNGESPLRARLRAANAAAGAPPPPAPKVTTAVQQEEQAEAPRSPFGRKPAGPTPGVEGYEPGQPCNGRGYYQSANGQGFIAVEAGHECVACAGAGMNVLPPETRDQRTTTPEQVAAAEEKPKRGRPKKEASPMKINSECEHCGGLFPVEKIDAHRESSHGVPPPKAQPAPEPVAPPKASLPTRGYVQELRKSEPESPTEELRRVAPERAARPRPPKDLILYVDCVPCKGGSATAIEEWLNPVAEIAAAAAVGKDGQPSPVDDYRLISYTADGVLAVAVREALASCPDALMLSSDNRTHKVAMEVLTPYAAAIVRGVR